MKKRNEIEQNIKLVIRDQIAINPIVSVRRVQLVLHEGGFQTYQGKPLDWHYVAKLVRKIHNENIATLKFQDKSARLIILRERYRVITDKLLKIVFHDSFPSGPEQPAPSYQEQIAAANMLMRWDLALFYAERDAGVFNIQIEAENPRNKPLDPETRARIMTAFRNWGLVPSGEE